MIILSQPLENLSAKIFRITDLGGRLWIRFPSVGGWADMTQHPTQFSIFLWGHVHGIERYLDWEFSIEEREAAKV